MADKMKNTAGRLSQACLISASSMAAALERAEKLAAQLVCTGGGEKPCGSCRACRKVREGIHPDVITLRRAEDDKGKQKREISVDQVRQLSADAWIVPNEAERKVYIIEEAESMNVPAQNAALKLLEEPPLGAVFLLCTTNGGKLLPTVRSRCVEIKCAEGQRELDEELMTLAVGYIKAVAAGDRAKLFSWCSAHEGMDGRQTAAFVDSAMEALGDMLCGRRKNPGLSPGELMRLYELLGRCSGYLRVNVGGKHIFGLLAVDSIAGGGNRGKAN